MAFEIEKLQEIQRRVEAACEKSARNSQDLILLAATKYADAPQINQAIEAGITLIGENRVQDAQVKFPLLLPVRKHFIGTLQKNKVKAAVRIFDCIESVDSLELASKINEESARISKKTSIFLEVNIAQDPKKHGFHSSEIFEVLKVLLPLEFLNVEGLMTIVPYFENPEDARPFFRKMRELYDLCRKKAPGIHVLSMGMSHDFEMAILEGATEIRVGSLLFR